MLPKAKAPEVVRSVIFFQSKKLQQVEYVEDDRPRASQDVLLKGFKQMDIVATLFLQVPEIRLPMDEPLIPGQKVSLIKLCHDRRDGGFAEDPQFFFVYTGYESLVKEHRRLVTEYCTMVETIEKCRVKRMLEVPVGGLFGLKLDEENYMRVRIVEIDLQTKMVDYWAVDEGKCGSCSLRDLLHLDTDCTVLSMLVIPGIFENAPRPDQLKKFEERKYCKVKVMQPQLNCDFGPRKISFG